MATRVVDVLVPVALDQAYSYRVPEGLELAPEGLEAVLDAEQEIIGDAVRNGGFPPLFIDPIDFAALYRERVNDLAGKEVAGQA